jgi:type II secretory pathway pseudopilin PulG
MGKPRGYMLIMLMVVVLVMSITLLAVAPLWETEIQRENEEELIFRGNQYVEAVRLYQVKHPGTFPPNLGVMVEERCLRKAFRDPMTIQGEWKIILLPGGPQSVEQSGTQASSPQQVLVAKLSDLASIDNPKIIGVVSTSTKKSFRIYHSQESYDKWLFFLGQDPNKLPEIIYFGQPAREENRQ